MGKGVLRQVAMDEPTAQPAVPHASVGDQSLDDIQPYVVDVFRKHVTEPLEVPARSIED